MKILTLAIRTRLSVLALCAAGSFALSGCETMTPRGAATVQGAGIGAIGGAIIGSATGGRAGAGALIGGAVGAVAGNLWSKRQEDRQRQMEQATRGTGIQVARTADDRLRIEVPSDVSFDTGSAAIKPELRRVMDRFADSLRGDQNVSVAIVGHTDSTGGDAVNYPLSVDRAASVRDYLATRGVEPQRVHIEGRGSREPVADNATAAGRSRNRRVEIFVQEARR